MTSRLRIAEQRAADRQHLLLAAGELRAAVGLAARRAAERSGRCARPSTAHPRPPRGDQAQMLVDREARPDAPSLRHIADAEAVITCGSSREDLAAGECGSLPRARALQARRWRCRACVLPMPLRPTTASTPRSSVSDTPCMRVDSRRNRPADRSILRAPAHRAPRSAMAASEIDLLHLAGRPRSPRACLP